MGEGRGDFHSRLSFALYVDSGATPLNHIGAGGSARTVFHDKGRELASFNDGSRNRFIITAKFPKDWFSLIGITQEFELWCDCGVPHASHQHQRV